MPYTWTVKKQFSASGDIAGYKSTRFEKLEASYGFVPSGSYLPGDTIVFPSVPQKDLVKAVFHSGSTVVTVYPSTSLAAPIAISTGGGTIDYQFEYVRNGNANNSISGTPAISLLTS